MNEADIALQSARASYADHDWQAAVEAFTTADASAALSPEDLDALADSAYWSCDPTKALAVGQRAYTAYLEEGRLGEAASTALRASLLLFVRGDAVVASGWADRARRLLAEIPECSAHAALAWGDAQLLLHLKSHDEALEKAKEVGVIASRVGDRDLVALALAMEGSVRVRMGDVSGGLGLLGEALAGAVAGELGSFATAEIMCEMVVSCLEHADYERAAEWLDTAEQGGRQLPSFPGCCRTHRATVLRHRGDWQEAQAQASQARAELAGIEVFHEGMALTEIGELHRCKGELTLAEKAFSEAYEKGWPPQPGLALLLLANGQLGDAAAIIRRSVDQCADEPAALMHLLPAQVEVALAADDIETVVAAAARMAEVTTTLGTSAAIGANACVSGLLLAAQGDVAGATSQLERSVRAWQRARSPYETAQARMRLAAVLMESGDTGSAKLEWVAARTTFERLGATPEAREAARRLGEDMLRRSECTFMFTDIVESTALLTTIGDDAWHGVRRWHDRTVTDIVAEHLGRVVKETGDGYFVTFDDPTLAVASAIAIQRALADHRRTDGFAPGVRIGLHTGSAIVMDDDYAGRDVVIAARIGALAGGDEVLISSDLADRLGVEMQVLPRTASKLKGIPEPVEIAEVNWR